jgi:phosphoglycolate phosphatase
LWRNQSGCGRNILVAVIDLAVIDLAGTLVRDDGAVEGAFVDALRAVGRIGGEQPDDALLTEIRETMGRSKIVVFGELLDGDTQRAELANVAFEEAYAGRISAGETTPLSTAAQALTDLRDAGVLIAVTTGFSSATRDELIRSLGWEDFVDLALSPTAELRGRPAPDLVLGALLQLRVGDVRRVAVAGDTKNDLLCGSRAGAGLVAGVLSGAHSREELESAPHTHLVDTVGDFAALAIATRTGELVPAGFS